VVAVNLEHKVEPALQNWEKTETSPLCRREELLCTGCGGQDGGEVLSQRGRRLEAGRGAVRRRGAEA
jgi:hypothetical protein